MTELAFEPYLHSTLPFGLSLPAGWERAEGVDGCALLAVEPPRDDAHFRANVVVTVESLPAGASLEGWAERSRDALRESLNRLRVIDLEVTELCGLPAHRTLAHYVHRQFGGVVLEQWALAERPLGFVLSCSGGALEYDDLADLNHMIAAGLRPSGAAA
jgi:hypothetical protein